MTRIIIADDQALFREGLRMLLSTRPDIDLVGEACDGNEAIALVERLQPSIVLMDLRMPNTDGIQATARIRERLYMAIPRYALPMLQVLCRVLPHGGHMLPRVRGVSGSLQ